jgi:nitroreductase
MDAFEAIAARYSARAFLPDPVPKETLEHAFGAAQRAASWCNIQPWRVVVTAPPVTNRLRAALLGVAATEPPEPDFPFPGEYPEPYLAHRRACGGALYQSLGIARGDGEGRQRAWLRNYEVFDAPHAAVVAMDRRWGVYAAIDVGVWLGTLFVALTAEGLSTCAQASLAAYPRTLRELLPIRPEEGILFGIAIGRADPAAPVNQFRTERAPLADNVQFVGF